MVKICSVVSCIGCGFKLFFWTPNTPQNEISYRREKNLILCRIYTPPTETIQLLLILNYVCLKLPHRLVCLVSRQVLSENKQNSTSCSINNNSIKLLCCSFVGLQYTLTGVGKIKITLSSYHIFYQMKRYMKVCFF